MDAGAFKFARKPRIDPVFGSALTCALNRKWPDYKSLRITLLFVFILIQPELDTRLFRSNRHSRA